MTALFVSDLHLDTARPAATDCFLRFLDGPARNTDGLYILGDLFETWTGDDAAGPHERNVEDGLRRYTGSGRACHLQRGNRDFLLGAEFASRTGVALLPDEAVVDIAGVRTLLMHGDTLCTDDSAYQRYRRVVHTPVVQAAYLGMPTAWRREIADFARRRSSAANAGKPAAIMDVNPQAVAGAMRRHGVRLLVHGHTHRPAVHPLEVDGTPARRIVLGDWYEQGSVLEWTPAGPDLRVLPFR